jgi:hypothetical protein
MARRIPALTITKGHETTYARSHCASGTTQDQTASNHQKPEKKNEKEKPMKQQYCIRNNVLEGLHLPRRHVLVMACEAPPRMGDSEVDKNDKYPGCDGCRLR